MARNQTPRAAILGCAATSLSEAERRFFAEADPLGFILFARNCESPPQVRALVAALRETVGRADAPVLIDQEGGRVARLGPPHWRKGPPAARFGALAARDEAASQRATWLHARLLADELAALGITVDCAPVLDLALPETHDVIGDRAFAGEPSRVAALGRAFCDGLLAGGVLPVVKHIPGHGRATADSHHELPVVEAGADVLRATDWVPFQRLADAPWAMTAHVTYAAIDAAAPATTSRRVIAEVIRGEIGFAGVLLSDDLGMQALAGDFAARAQAVLAAGCDVALHCSGDMAEMTAVIAATPSLSEAARERIARAEAQRGRPGDFDRAAALAELDALLAAA
ncbi:MAG TPA: beta-N-acetylhexosaminidase [Alphaproteobacteria bacterium]|nr:beta-N-acetylhexosaminidase [Alphaproteobacteria bacterium]